MSKGSHTEGYVKTLIQRVPFLTNWLPVRMEERVLRKVEFSNRWPID